VVAAHTNGSATTRVTPPRIPAQRRPPVDVVHGADTGAATPPTPRRGTGYLPHRYDVSGVVTIGSDVRLRELEYFRAPWLGRGLDIEIRVGEVSRRLRTRAKLTRRAHPVAIRYEEHLGRFGANFHIDLGDRIAVTVDPLLARSPHVLYTNVIEALLRFVMVTHGKMLLHSACIEFDGHGVMLSARTDTGKTGTVLRLLREHGARFLSDDMTVLEPSGAASCFPKPLTISAHTLRAVDPGDMSRREWQWLRLQGLLHSKEGRAWGMLLGEANLPIMSINSLTQMVVPPPKYIVDRLVPSDVIREVQVRDMFIIERGPNSLMQLDAATALDELIENTDDAYGFPPFRYFAPALVLGDADYDELRTRERAILAAALSNMRIRRMASDSFGWADEIPALLKRASVPERIELPDEQRKVRIVLPNADQDAAASARPSGSP
jgi:dolichol-phosphate mannosyltransferase